MTSTAALSERPRVLLVDDNDAILARARTESGGTLSKSIVSSSRTFVAPRGRLGVRTVPVRLLILKKACSERQDQGPTSINSNRRRTTLHRTRSAGR